MNTLDPTSLRPALSTTIQKIKLNEKTLLALEALIEADPPTDISPLARSIGEITIHLWQLQRSRLQLESRIARASS